jgi:hypothetical protein
VNENFLTTQGASVSIAGVLRDSAGDAILNRYDGSEALVTFVWPGGNRAASFTPATTWDVPAAGTFFIAITAAATATLYPGVYEGVTRLATGSDNGDAFYFTLTVAYGPGGFPAAPTATTITRLVVEVALIRQNAALLQLCGKSVLANGDNPHLTDVIGEALNLLGVQQAVPDVVTDDDLARLDAGKLYLLYGLCKYVLTRDLLDNFAQPDRSAGSTKTSLNAMIERYRQQMLGLEKRYAAYLGKYRSVLTAGSIRVRPTSGSGTSWGGDF